MSDGHNWRFFRAGGFDQVKLSSGADLSRLGMLDQKLWVALACPTSGLEFDARTTALIDTDGDGRIRAPELLAAVSFACRNLRSSDDLLRGSDTLSLAAIVDATDEGRALLGSAKQVLAARKKPEATALFVEDFADGASIFTDTAFNGDGVIILESASDEGLKTLIGEIGVAVGTTLDRSGKQGISQTHVDTFWAAAAAFDTWWKQGQSDPGTWPLGEEKTRLAAAVVTTLQTKVDDYFTRCRLAAFDARTALVANGKEDDYAAVLSAEVSPDAIELRKFPVALVAAGRALPLAEGVNPAYASAVAALRQDAVVPLLGDRQTLSEGDWTAIKERLAPYVAWQNGKQGAEVAALGVARVRAILASDAAASLAKLIVQDLALAPEVAALENLERLVRYNRDLFKLCTNFVNFKDFYDGGEPAIFQTGTLYLDQRSCVLCLPVDDATRHAAMAGLAGVYLVYLDCERKSGQKRQIVAAFTAGDSDNLMVGRNGIFYDRKGDDWDATITKIIDNPISIRQAFFSPYKKFARFLEEQVAKRAAAAEADVHKDLDETAKAAANADKGKPPVVAKKIDIGSVAALGVAFGAIGSFLTALIGYATGVFSLGPLATVGAVLVVLLVISLPSVVMAFLKLRKRNLGPILDANGWAINTRARINVPFGATLTSVAKLPPGARRDQHDRYAERTFPWKSVLVLLLVLYSAWSWYQGRWDAGLPERLQSKTVLGSWAPQGK